MQSNRQGNSYIWIAVAVGIVIVIGAYMFTSSQSNTTVEPEVTEQSGDVMENATSTAGDAMMEGESTGADAMIEVGVEAQ
jgi:uncharacterized protein with FMN-binding domain